MEPVTKEAIEQGRKVRGRWGDTSTAVKAMWVESPNGDPAVVLWWEGYQLPNCYNPISLALVPEPERREVWLNVYGDLGIASYGYPTQNEANRESGPTRQGPAVYIPLIRDGGAWRVDVERVKN